MAREDEAAKRLDLRDAVEQAERTLKNSTLDIEKRDLRDVVDLRKRQLQEFETEIQDKLYREFKNAKSESAYKLKDGTTSRSEQEEAKAREAQTKRALDEHSAVASDSLCEARKAEVDQTTRLSRMVTEQYIQIERFKGAQSESQAREAWLRNQLDAKTLQKYHEQFPDQTRYQGHGR